MNKFVTSTKQCLPQFCVFSLASVGLWCLARVVYISLLFPERVLSMQMDSFILLQGLRFDLVTLGYLLAIPVLLTLALSLFDRIWQGFQKLLTVYLTLCFALVLFMELATPSFIEQYDARPNILFVEYLRYPRELLATLIKGYSVDLLAALLIVPAAMLALGWTLSRYHRRRTATLRGNLVLLPLVVVVWTLAIRGTLAHRPINPSVIAVTSDLMVNSLPLNSTYSLLYALYSEWHDAAGDVSYGSMPPDEAIALVRASMQLAPDAFFDDRVPTLHHQAPSVARARPLNLVIVLEESLGAEFVGALGGLPLTPHLDALRDQSLWFERMYATGTRSVRGIEAVITGFPPTPARSVVKLQKSQSGFFSLASLLQKAGYETSFIYGGRAHFDNMRGFFAGNGFSTIIEERDFVAPQFRGSWGVSDEDLFAEAHKTFAAYGNKPFFSLVFSSSNHSPFEYPPDRIEPFDDEFHTVNNAVKYADHALGQFFETARQADYWANTVFVVVADHNSRVYGDDLVPIERFHIPALIMGADIEPQRYERVASQIDLIPTVLELMGVAATHPVPGVNLLRPEVRATPGRAIMQFNRTQAYLQGEELVVLQPGLAPRYFHYRDRTLEPAARRNPEVIRTALAFANFGPYVYGNRMYRLPDSNEMTAKSTASAAPRHRNGIDPAHPGGPVDHPVSTPAANL